MPLYSSVTKRECLLSVVTRILTLSPEQVLLTKPKYLGLRLILRVPFGESDYLQEVN